MSLGDLRSPWSRAPERRHGRAELILYLVVLIVGTAAVWGLALFGAAQLWRTFL